MRISRLSSHPTINRLVSPGDNPIREISLSRICKWDWGGGRWAMGTIESLKVPVRVTSARYSEDTRLQGDPGKIGASDRWIQRFLLLFF